MVAALNTGKLPPALSALRGEFGLSLVEVGWLTSLLMLSAAVLGIAGGSIADRFGHRRIMTLGLVGVAAGSALGAVSVSAPLLFFSRVLESLGFILTVLPGPALLQRCVPVDRLRGWLGGWSTYLPAGMCLVLLLGPWLIESVGWRSLWGTCALLALVWAWAITRAHPPERAVREADSGATRGPSLRRLALMTVSAPGPWLLMVCFLFYAAQFLGIFTFLPTIYRDSGIDPRLGGAFTALAVLVNAAGNLASGHLLQRGHSRSGLIVFASISMALTAWVVFGSEWPFALRYVAVLWLSASGGLIPGTLFASAPAYSPDPRAVSTTVGLMQQGSGIGQILVPPLIAVLAQWQGNWSLTWVVTGSCALIVAATALAMGRFDQRRPAAS